MASDPLQPSAVRRIAKEVAALTNAPPDGIRVIINEEDIADVNAWVAGPLGTPYEGGYFKVKFTFEKEYPAAPPKGYFVTKIFHPNVGPQGDICVSTLKRDWSSKSTLTHILTVIKCLLIYPNPESALDEEAGRLLLDQYEEYASRAKLMTQVHAGVRAPKPVEFEIETNAERESRLAATPAAAAAAAKVSAVASKSCPDAFNFPVTTSAPVPLQPSAPSNAQNGYFGPMTSLIPPATSVSKKRSASSALGAGAQATPSNTGENQKSGAGVITGTGAAKKVGAVPAKKRGLKRL